jgi:hypothetical protein
MFVLEMCLKCDPNMLQNCFILWLAHECWNLETQHVCSWNVLEMWSKHAWNVIQTCFNDAPELLPIWSVCTALYCDRHMNFETAWYSMFVLETCLKCDPNVLETCLKCDPNVLEMWSKHAPELLENVIGTHEFWNWVTQDVRSWNMLEMWSKCDWNVIQTCLQCDPNMLQNCNLL